MPHRSRYQLPSRRRRPVGTAVGLIVLALLAIGCWVFWPVREVPESLPPPEPHTAGPSPTPASNTLPPGPILLTKTQSVVQVAPSIWADAVTSIPPATVAAPSLVITTSAPPQAAVPKLRVRKPAAPEFTVFQLQLVLDRLALSPGSLDGVMGFRTRGALCAFQERERLNPSGALDLPTRLRLPPAESPYTNYVVTAKDLNRLLPLGKTWLDKWHQPRLDYETVLELVAEKAHSHPELIRRLNPDVRWDEVEAGTSLTVPNVFRPAVTEKAAFAAIRLGECSLEAFGDQTNLLAHFPCSIARKDEKRPLGELKVAVIAPHPDYTYNPASFPTSTEARQSSARLVLAPGPNNPVGTVWVGLDREGYGIHGAPHPERVGQPESMGCFRLTNWNAEYFLQLVWVGMPVLVEP